MLSNSAAFKASFGESPDSRVTIGLSCQYFSTPYVVQAVSIPAASATESSSNCVLAFGVVIFVASDGALGIRDFDLGPVEEVVGRAKTPARTSAIGAVEIRLHSRGGSGSQTNSRQWTPSRQGL